jgi:hypothetical protein
MPSSAHGVSRQDYWGYRRQLRHPSASEGEGVAHAASALDLHFTPTFSSWLEASRFKSFAPYTEAICGGTLFIFAADARGCTQID